MLKYFSERVNEKDGVNGKLCGKFEGSVWYRKIFLSSKFWKIFFPFILEHFNFIRFAAAIVESSTFCVDIEKVFLDIKWA